MDRHRSLLRFLVAALRDGTEHARSYADWQDEEIDRMLAPALVRKGAKRFLLSSGDDSTPEVSDEEVEYDAEYLPNLGLSVTNEGDRIRILKSDNDSLPVPGPSQRRQAFYAQQRFLFPVRTSESDLSSNVNLVLHWVADGEYNLERVYLACPKAGGETRRSVEAYWDEIIWRRGKIAASASQVEATAEDLDIFLQEGKSGTSA